MHVEMNKKNVLIISHVPLSNVNNNGKTLVSIFKGISAENIYQIYLNSDIPDYDDNCHYLQINEKQIVQSVLQRKNLCCQEISANGKNISSASIKTGSFAMQAKRLLREGIWKVALWKSKLKEWLSDKKFDVVFFMAGDGLFAYDIYNFVIKNTNAKGCLFFTDDYIIGKSSRSPFALIRRLLLKRKMKRTLQSVKNLYVISEEMKKAYSEIFGREGYVIRNFSVEKREGTSADSNSNNEMLTMVYAGGLHYNRWKVLGDIARVLQKINGTCDVKCVLKVYSSQKISSEIIDYMVVDGASKFMGGVSAAEIAGVYANSDILLHVESFDKKAVASTKYSFSTKIPEYLSAEKCVLAVGPSEVASVQYLADCACVISDGEDLFAALSKLINDNDYRNKIKDKCRRHYEKDFSLDKQRECLQHILSS